METIFFYDFEISKQGLLNCLHTITSEQNSKAKTYGNATSFFVQMGVASLTLLENAFKCAVFNFDENSLVFVQKLLEEICYQFENKNISENSYVTYLQLLGAYFGWCVVKKHKAYFATVEKEKVLVLNNKIYNPTLIVKMCGEDKRNLIELFKNF